MHISDVPHSLLEHRSNRSALVLALHCWGVGSWLLPLPPPVNTSPSVLTTSCSGPTSKQPSDSSGGEGYMLLCPFLPVNSTWLQTFRCPLYLPRARWSTRMAPISNTRLTSTRRSSSSAMRSTRETILISSRLPSLGQFHDQIHKLQTPLQDLQPTRVAFHFPLLWACSTPSNRIGPLANQAPQLR